MINLQIQCLASMKYSMFLLHPSKRHARQCFAWKPPYYITPRQEHYLPRNLHARAPSHCQVCHSTPRQPETLILTG